MFSLFTYIAISFLTFSTSFSKSYAFELSSGLAGVEEGDDRYRPSAFLHIGYNPFFYSRAYYYGRTMGPITENTYLLSFNRRFGLFRATNLEGAFGVCTLLESTKLEHTDEQGTQKESESNFNLGTTFGVFWSPFQKSEPFYFSVGWESHLFLAGSAGIFLSTGRKHVVSLGAGLKI